MKNREFRPLFSAPGRKSGFSLVELLLVLLLLGVGSLIVLPAIERALNQREVRQTALSLAAVARSLRGKAIYEGAPRRLTLDRVENSYQGQGGKKVYLPTQVRFSEISGGEPGEGQEQRFVFFPNGSVLGDVVTVEGEENATSYRVRLDALSGRVAVEESHN
jgi:general secretion pathway protein H